MKKRTAKEKIFIVSVIFCAVASAAVPANAALKEEAYYARCNIKVLKGNEINWLNFRSAEKQISIGAGLKVVLSADRAVFKDAMTGEAFRVDLGAPGAKFLEKLAVKEPVDIDKLSRNHAAEVRGGAIKTGMTKEEVYAAMCAPAFIGSDISEQAGYAEVLAADKWTYKTSKFGGNIVIEFDKNGLATSITGPGTQQEEKK